MISERSLLLAERAVPRYTSYPTAPHFSQAVGPSDQRRWLADLPANANLSLYLHVPFCREICAYCGCHTKATRQEAPLTAYKETLLREINPKPMADARVGKPYALLLFGMMIWTFSWYRRSGPIAPKELAARIADLYANGFRNLA